MEIKVLGHNIILTDRQRAYVEEKIAKLKRYAERMKDESTEVKVEISHHQTKKEEDSITCQITVFAPNAVIRAETRKPTVESAIDRVHEKLVVQIERYKSRLHRRDRKGRLLPLSTLEEVTQETHEQDVPKDTFEAPTIIKRKRFSNTTPMTEEEAIEHMELIGHSAFIFNNSESKRYSMVYKRENGFYGIVEPKMPGDEETL